MSKKEKEELLINLIKKEIDNIELISRQGMTSSPETVRTFQTYTPNGNQFTCIVISKSEELREYVRQCVSNIDIDT